MSDILSFLLFLALAYYGASIVGLVIGLQRLAARSSTKKPPVSIIVAARNEEKAIGRLMECLIRQDYPDFEVIVANDRSSDDTGRIIAEYESRDTRVKQVRIAEPSPTMPGKKNALTQAILQSRGEILCFTDADCTPGQHWISELVKGFDPEVGLVAGYSPYDVNLIPEGSENPGYLLARFIEFEEFKGATWAAGSIGMRKGWLCTGRNLAYRRSVWDEAGRFGRIKHSISGDDDLFLQLIRRTTKWEIHYVSSPDSMVPTSPPSSFTRFIEQRKRHFSAGKFFSPQMKTFFFLFHASNLLMFVGLLFALFDGAFVFGAWGFLGKLCFDTLLFSIARTRLRFRKFQFSFLFFELLYLFYNTLVGPLGLVGRFEWKPELKA